jgi:opacity protein-like surface antigen
MRKLLVFGMLGISLLVLSGTSLAASPYFSGNLGLVSVSDADVNDAAWSAAGFSNAEISFDSGIGLTLASGVDTGIVRVEGEFSYRKNDMDDLSYTYMGVSYNLPVNGEVESMALMGNVVKDIKTNGPLTPFFGIGIGISKLDAELQGESEDDTVFAYQLILGTGIEVAENAMLDISYRYFATDDPEYDGTEIEYGTHNFMLGVRFDF